MKPIQSHSVIAHRRAIASALIPILILVCNISLASQASSGGYGENIQVDATIGIVEASASSGPLPLVSASGANNYGPISEAAVNLSVLLNGHPLAGASVLRATASHQRNPRDVSGHAAVDDLALDLQLTPLVPLATLGADQVTADARITGRCGSLGYEAGSTLTNARVEALNGVGIDLMAEPAPNTVVDLSVLGGELANVSLVLNEQLISGNGIDALSVEVNAIHLTLNVNVLGLLTLDGEIIISHAHAALDCATVDLEVGKSADQTEVTVGETLNYQLVVENLGPDQASHVRLVDALDVSADLVSLTTSNGGSCSVSAQQVVTCEWSQVEAGGTRVVDMAVIPRVAGNLVNSVVSETDDHDPTDDNNTDTVTTPVQPLGSDMADLNVMKTAIPAMGIVGEPVVWTLSVSNAGPDQSGPLELVDTLPADISDITVISTDGSCVLAGSTLTCSWQDLGPGASHTVQVEAVPQVPGDLVNSVSVAAGAEDPNPDDNTDVVVTPVDPATDTTADNSVVVSASPDTVRVGDSLTLGLSLLNAGPDAASQVALGASVGEHLQIGALSGSLAPFCGSSEGSIQCDLTQLASGSELTLMIEATALVEGVAEFGASVSAQTADPDPSNNQDEISLTVDAAPAEGAADLVASIEVVPGSVAMGSPALIQITAFNAGPDPATDNVSLTYQVGEGAQVMSHSVTNNGACTRNATQVTCNWSALAVGDEELITIELRPHELGQLENAAEARADQPPDPDMSNNSAIDVLAIMESATDIAACQIEQVTENPLDPLATRLSSGGGAILLGFAQPGLHDSAGNSINHIVRHGERKLTMVSNALSGFDGSARMLAASRSLRYVVASMGDEVRMLDRSSGDSQPLGLDLVSTEAGRLIDIDDAGRRVVAVATMAGETGLWRIDDGEAQRIATSADVTGIMSLAISGNGQIVAMTSRGNPAGDNPTAAPRLFVFEAGQWRSRDTTGLDAMQVTDIGAAGETIALRAQSGGQWAVFLSAPGTVTAQVPGTQSALPPSARLTTNATAVIAGTTDVSGNEQLRRVVLESGDMTSLYQGNTGDAASFRLLDSDAQGNVVAFASSNSLLADNADGSMEVFVVDCLVPRQGLWWNPARAGHGLFLGNARDDRMFIQWYTYGPLGSPVWYVALAERKAASWGATLYRATREGGALMTEPVGSVALGFRDGEHALFHWTVEGVTRTERFQFDEFGGYASPSDRTGSWYRPSENGWGLSLAESGTSQAALLFVHDAEGQPVWFIASGARDGSAKVLSQLRGEDLCPTTCPVTARPATARVMGAVTLSPVNHGRELSVQFIADAVDGVDLSITRPTNPYFNLNELNR